MKIKIKNKSKLTFINPSNEEDTIDITIVQPSIYNKSKKYVKYLNDILDTDTNKQWYFNFIKKYQMTQDNDIVYKEFLDRIIKMGVKYSKKMNDIIDISSFVNRKKKTSNSVLFDEKEVFEIYMLSAIVKLYAIFSGTNLCQSGLDKLNKYAFDYIIQKVELKATVNKIHHVVYTKLFKCIGLDPTIMKTIQLRSTMSDDDFVLYLFDYVLSAILVIYDMQRNPITFIVTSVDQVMIWHFRGLYQKSIAYKDTGELFGKSLSNTNLPDMIISDKIYEYVQEFVSKRNKDNNVVITEDYGSLDKYFHNFFVIPLYNTIFNIKNNDSYNSFQKMNIQLFLYYTMKDYIEKTGNSLFPKVKDENIIQDKNNFEKYKLLELLKRLPQSSGQDTYKMNGLNIFEDSDFSMDDSKSHRNSFGFQFTNLYKIECLVELLTSNFNFYGINNIMILNNYLKTVMASVVGLIFKNLFTFDLTKSEFRCKRFSKQLELEIFPFLMVILNNNMEFFNEFSEYISNTYCINRSKKRGEKHEN